MKATIKQPGTASRLGLGRPTRHVRPLAENETPAFGAHLVTPRFGFAHHGIYAGNGNVVHYGALMYDVIRKPVEEVSLECFAQGRPVFLISHAERTLPAAEVLRRARSRMGENKYSLLTNNCEHFCEWALHGAQRSFQVEMALSFPGLLGERVQAALLRLVRRLLRRLGRVPRAAGDAAALETHTRRR